MWTEPATPRAGSPVTYVIAITNKGPAAHARLFAFWQLDFSEPKTALPIVASARAPVICRKARSGPTTFIPNAYDCLTGTSFPAGATHEMRFTFTPSTLAYVVTMDGNHDDGNDPDPTNDIVSLRGTATSRGGGTGGPSTGNRPPVVRADNVASEKSAGSIAVLSNDSDPDGDAFRITAWTQPAFGSASCQESTCRYLTGPKYLDHDSFQYTVTDARGASTKGRVFLRFRRGSVRPRFNDGPRGTPPKKSPPKAVPIPYFTWAMRTRTYNGITVDKPSDKLFWVEAIVKKCRPGLGYEWAVDLKKSPQRKPCHAVFRLAEGLHRVVVTFVARDGRKAKTVQNILVQDWLILSLGDSVASGEGNPPWRSAMPGAVACHRSVGAAPARAATALEDSDPHTSVTLVHVACSGATIGTGILEPFKGQPPQAAYARGIVGDREIDAVVVSIGANDISFSAITAECIFAVDCHDTGETAREIYDLLVDNLPGIYSSMNFEFDRMDFPAARVNLVEYFDPTRDENGEFCDRWLKVGLTNWISAVEARWAAETVLGSINSAGRIAAARHGWNQIVGVASDFRTHGYCSKNRWIVRISAAITDRNRSAPLHPNAKGHAATSKRIQQALRAQLYPGGVPQTPRRGG